MLNGKKGLIIGVANEQSIASGCSTVCASSGAALAITYASEKSMPYVKPVADKVNADIFLPFDVTNSEQQEKLFSEIAAKWGKLDFLIHSVAFAPKEDLQGSLLDSTAAGFALAMDISCHSFIRLAKSAQPLMKEGGTLISMSYYGAHKAIANYDLMGPVKAALETSAKYLAYELGQSNIRVNIISPGPIKTRAASGLKDFDALLDKAKIHSPLNQLTTIEQVGQMAAFLVSDHAKTITGQVIYIDAGESIVA